MAPEGPAPVLRDAAARMREDARRRGDAPGSFLLAVSAWLEGEARQAAGMELLGNGSAYEALLAGFALPLAVASAYPGEPAAD